MFELVKVSAKMHRDPADQLIVATVKLLGAKLMSDDKAISRLS